MERHLCEKTQWTHHQEVFMYIYLRRKHREWLCAACWDLLADVLGVQHLVADSTLEAAQVPVLVQGHQRLLVPELLPTAAAV